MSTIEKDLGRHDADIETLKKAIVEIKDSLKVVADYVTTQKAERNVILVLLTSGVASLISWIDPLTKLFGHKT
jgi:hypothetical protein